MPRGLVGDGEIVLDKEERKIIPSGFCALGLKHWLLLKIYRFKLY
jgi:hypothetical protein